MYIHLSHAPTATCQYHPSGITSCALSFLPTTEVQVPPWREPTILLVQILVQELVPSLNHEPWFFLWSTLVNPNLTGSVTLTRLIGHIDTVDSDLMHHQYRFTVLQWNPGQPAGTPPSFHAVILQEASDHVPHISDQFATLLNKDTFEPDPMVVAFKEDSTSKGTWVWSHLSFEACCAALHFLEHRRLHFALYTSTMSWPRNVTLPLISYDGYTGT